MTAETEQEPISLKEKISYGLGDFACNLSYSPMASLLPMYYTNIAGIGTAAFASVMMIGRILDAVFSIIMGFLVDRTESPQGKTRPWILRFCVPLAVSTVLLFSVPSSFTGTRVLIWLFVFYNVAKTICYTAVNIPYGSMLSYLTGDPDERGRLNTIRITSAYIAQFLLNAFVLKAVRQFGGGDLNNRTGWTITFSLLAVISLVFYLICWKNVHERIHPDSKKEPVQFSKALRYLFTNRNWLVISFTFIMSGLNIAVAQSSVTYFAQYNLGNVDYYPWLTNSVQVTQVLCLLFLAGRLQKRLGKIRMFRTGLPIVFIGALTAVLCRHSAYGVIAGCIIMGLGRSMESAVNYSLVPDALDQNGDPEGARYMGMGTATAFFLMKIAASFGTLLWSKILNTGGFDPALQVQSASGLNAVLVCYLGIPMITSVLNLLVLSLWKDAPAKA